MANHKDVGCSEHQIRLSKGLIAKFVQRLELWARKKPPVWWLVCLCFCDWNCVYFKSSKLVGMKWQVFWRVPRMGGNSHPRDGRRRFKELLAVCPDLGVTVTLLKPTMRIRQAIGNESFDRHRRLASCCTLRSSTPYSDFSHARFSASNIEGTIADLPRSSVQR